MNDAMSDLETYIDDFSTRNMNGEFADYSDEEFYKTFAEGAMDVLEGYMDSFTYAEATNIVVLVYEDTDGLYTISDNDFTNLDTNMVLYP